MNGQTMRERLMDQLEGVQQLGLAYVGVVNGLFSALAALGRASGKDPGYVTRWCDAAYACELLEEPEPEVFVLSRLGYQGMAFQNLSEHVQGNHFLRPEEVVSELQKAGMEASVYLFMDGREAVIVGRRTA